MADDAQVDPRVERFSAALQKVSGGDQTAFGRKLGYKDGGFVRQMLSGRRPISEKTVKKVESLPGMGGWFGIGSTSTSGPASSPPTAATQRSGSTLPLGIRTAGIFEEFSYEEEVSTTLDRLTSILSLVPVEQREAVAQLLATLARTPHAESIQKALRPMLSSDGPQGEQDDSRLPFLPK